MKVLKRDNETLVNFKREKIIDAIMKASNVSDSKISEYEATQIAINIERLNKNVTVEEIGNMVEIELMRTYPSVAKNYILYREMRANERERAEQLNEVYKRIVDIDNVNTDVQNENANMSGHTPSGQMMKFASEVSKEYTHKHLLKPEYSLNHLNGDIHIHDLDYYATKTTTCVQYNLDELFKNGFFTKHGYVSEPQSITTYASLAAIVFQTNQNEQHGGQAIPAFDFFMAPGVIKSYKKHLYEILLNYLEIEDKEIDESLLKSFIDENVNSIDTKVDDFKLDKFEVYFENDQLNKILKIAYSKTQKETYKAMRAFIYNLNTMHSRGGNQVVFSSINYGTDTSPEGRMVMMELLRATNSGLSKGETPIFPIQIFKVKEGVNFSEEDYRNALLDFDGAMNGKMNFVAPNFDVFLRSIETTSKRLFPNYVFLDSTFNHHSDWDEFDPYRWKNEIATMGCRTRVFDNVHGKKTSVGRGNASFTSINLPRLAIESKQEILDEIGDKDIERYKEMVIARFLSKVRVKSELVAEQLKDRVEFQKTALIRQFPFMMQNNIWAGGSNMDPNGEVGELVHQGTLGIGFIGGHNAMVAIFGEGHGKNKEAYHTLHETVSIIKDVAEEYKSRYRLNYAALGTPAEGLSGRFTKLDREKFGVIEGVNDREYYINSFHVDVKEEISAFEKIKLEAPFHKLTKGGHITYIELDAEAKKNPGAIMKLIKVMKDEEIGYGSINHPVDRCRNCGYQGIIYDDCPICSSTNISKTRRITGYLTGDLDTWNSYKVAEERDRVKHNLAHNQHL